MTRLKRVCGLVRESPKSTSAYQMQNLFRLLYDLFICKSLLKMFSVQLQRLLTLIYD